MKDIFYNAFTRTWDNFDSLAIFKVLAEMFNFYFFLKNIFLLFVSKHDFRCVLRKGNNLPFETSNLSSFDEDLIAD